MSEKISRLDENTSLKILLNKEQQRQWKILANHFAEELGYTKEEYISTLPKFGPQPEGFEGRLKFPGIAETRISIERQCKILGIRYSPTEGLGKNGKINPSQTEIETDQPYAFWTDMGLRYPKQNWINVLNNKDNKPLFPGEYGGGCLEGISVFIAMSDILKKRFLDLPGIKSDPGKTAILFLMGNKPEIGFRPTNLGNGSVEISPLICGRQ